MNCPKNLRNGPCGGVRAGGFCEVKPQMHCVWVMAWEGAARMRGGAQINDVQPPVNRSLEGSSSWLRVAREKAARAAGPTDAPRDTIARAFPMARAHEPAAAPLAPEPPSAADERVAAMNDPMPDDFARWQPSYDAPPPGHVSGSRLERVLRQGEFAVTAELNPPDSADPADVFKAARPWPKLPMRSTRPMPRAPTATCPRSGFRPC